MSENDRNGRNDPPEPPSGDEEISIEFLDDEGRPFDADPASHVHVSPDEPDRKGIAESEPQPAEEEGNLRERLEEARDRYIRLRADFENYRRRVDRDRDEYRRLAVADVVSLLLPVLDNLNRALKVLESEAPREWCQGLELVQQHFGEALRKLGMEEIDALGKPFDPNLHEAVMVVSRPDLPSGTISEVFEKGYSLGGKVVKPARVVVTGEESGDQGTRRETDA
jgi:molecular chaperone GrpE